MAMMAVMEPSADEQPKLGTEDDPPWLHFDGWSLDNQPRDIQPGEE